jgi:hypothetical protein
MAAKNNPKEKTDNLWAKYGVRIGVISGGLGILITLINVLKPLMPDKKKTLDQLELAQKVNEYSPKLEAAYFSFSEPTYFALKGGDVKNFNESGNYFLNYPILPNEVNQQSDSSGGGLITAGDETERITYLVIQNKGKNEARDVELSFNQYAVKDTVRFTETAGENTPDYEQKIKENSGFSAKKIFKVPSALATGKGIMIPLFKGAYKSFLGKSWNILPGISYMPVTISYTDPLDNSVHTVTVRKMLSVVKFDNGIEGRG